MAVDENDDPVFGCSGSSYLNISQDALLSNNPHKACNQGHSGHHGSIGIAPLGVVVGLAIAGGIGWYVYSHLPGTIPADTEIPILHATSEAVKVRPSEPGGMEVLNRDRLVYQQLGEVVTTSEEHLLPLAETPTEPSPAHKPAMIAPVSSKGVHSAASVEGDLAMPVVVAPLEKSPPAVPHPVAITPSVGQPVGQLERRPVSVEDLITRNEPAPGTRTQQKDVTVSASTAATSSHPSLTTATKTVASPPTAIGEARLQLGSFKSREDAEKAWSQLTIRHSDLLRGASHMIVQVELREKGVWHRIYAGLYGGAQAALSACKALKQRNVGCIFVSK